VQVCGSPVVDTDKCGILGVRDNGTGQLWYAFTLESTSEAIATIRYGEEALQLVLS